MLKSIEPIIQLSELSENYNLETKVMRCLAIIQLSELSENYNSGDHIERILLNYTTI